ncbi:MAG: DUF3267 domain-containing protein [Anaerolineae bacterium]|nr:DUF3267 domain-containing protein [Anaerolineae bacterium]
MSTETSPNGAMSSNYRQVLYWRISEKRGRVILMNLLAIPLACLLGVGFLGLVLAFGRPFDIDFESQTIMQGLIQLGLTVIVALAVFPLHEGVHGLAMRIFGAHPKYGVMWQSLMFYATAPGHAFSRNSYLVIALAPFVILSLLAGGGIWLLAGSPSVFLPVFFGVINGSGAIGDLWICTIVLRYPAHARIIDERDGIRVLLPTREEDALD